MKITVAGSEAAFDTIAAGRIAGQICARPRSVIGLSTGRTTGNIHREVCRMHAEADFDISRVTFFGLDEVTGVDRFLMLPTRSDDFAAACREFTAELDRRGGIDLLILGLGENGHLGFNQPGTPFGSHAWHTVMDPTLEARIRRETATPAGVALGGVTLGLADIMHARRIVLVAKGANKRQAVGRMLCGPVCEDLPASILQLHPDCEFLLDTAAAADIDINSLRNNE